MPAIGQAIRLRIEGHFASVQGEMRSLPPSTSGARKSTPSRAPRFVRSRAPAGARPRSIYRRTHQKISGRPSGVGRGADPRARRQIA